MKLLISIATAVIVSALATARADIIDGVAAIVNDRVITYSEVKEYVQPVIQQLRRDYSGQALVEAVRSAQMDALNGLIDRSLIIQEFHKKGFSFPDRVIEGQITDIIATEFNNDRSAFIRTLQAQGLTMSQYRERVRDRIIIQAMRNRKISQENLVSPKKIEKYYEENADQFKVGDQIKLRMIYIKRALPVPPPSDKETPGAITADQGTERILVEPLPRDPARELADDLVRKLDAGESFEAIARTHSAGKEAKDGGDWGWIGRDVLRKELNEVAFKLPAKHHSPVIETAEGFYILKVEDIKEAHSQPLSEVRDDIEKILLQQQRSQLQERWVKELRQRAFIRLF
jgi:peptidyl-prolyl cis-trans isomerase SurA